MKKPDFCDRLKNTTHLAPAEQSAIQFNLTKLHLKTTQCLPVFYKISTAVWEVIISEYELFRAENPELFID
jgi:hypothetical protein